MCFGVAGTTTVSYPGYVEGVRCNLSGKENLMLSLTSTDVVVVAGGMPVPGTVLPESEEKVEAGPGAHRMPRVYEPPYDLWLRRPRPALLPVLS
jgi:hypothetical protein